MSKREKWWQGDDEQALDEAARQLDGLSPAQAYLARQLDQLSRREHEHAQVAEELRATVAALKTLLLASGVLDEAALAAHIAQARTATSPTGADTEEDLARAHGDTVGSDLDAWLDADDEPVLPPLTQPDEEPVKAPEPSASPTARQPRGGTRLGPGLLGSLPRQGEQGPQARPAPMPRREGPVATTELVPSDAQGTRSSDEGAESAEVAVGYPRAATVAPALAPHRADVAPYDDDDDDFSTGGRGRRVILLLMVAAVLIGVPAWYYGVHKNPYIGDGPAHLQVDPSRVRAVTAAGDGTKAAPPAAGVSTPSARAPSAQAPKAKTPSAKTPSAKTPSAKTLAEKPASKPPVAETHPNQARYAELMTRARALFAKRRAGPAYGLVRQAHKLRADGWEALERLAWFYYSRGATGRGRKLAKQTLTLHPDAPYALLVQAAAAHERGKRAVAKAGYQRFLELCKACPEAADIRAALRSL